MIIVKCFLINDIDVRRFISREFWDELDVRAISAKNGKEALEGLAIPNFALRCIENAAGTY